MKNIFLVKKIGIRLLFLLFFGVTVLSCQKELIEPNEEGENTSIRKQTTTGCIRLFRLNSGVKHFYTTDLTERQNFLNSGWVAEDWENIYVYNNSGEGRVPLYRYYSSGTGDYFFTTLGGGKTISGYTLQGISCYVYNIAGDNRVRFYRYFALSNGTHFYTTLGGGAATIGTYWNLESEVIYVYNTPPPSYLPGYIGDFDTDHDGTPEKVYWAQNYITITELTGSISRKYYIDGSKWSLTKISNFKQATGVEFLFSGIGFSQIMVFSEPGSQNTYTISNLCSAIITSDLDGVAGNEVLFNGGSGVQLGHQYIFCYRTGQISPYTIPNNYAYLAIADLDGDAGNEILWNAGLPNPGYQKILNYSKRTVKDYSIPGSYACKGVHETDGNTNSAGNEVVWLSKNIGSSGLPNAIITMNYNRGLRTYNFGTRIYDIFDYLEINGKPGIEIRLKEGSYGTVVKGYVDDYNKSIKYY